jgi:tetratricopeptide (TPR) repeat protein
MNPSVRKRTARNEEQLKRRLRALLANRLPAREAQRLRQIVREDRGVLGLLDQLVAEWAASARPEHPIGTRRPAPEAIRAVAREGYRRAVEDLVDEVASLVGLGLRRAPAVAVVGGGGAPERREVLDRIQSIVAMRGAVQRIDATQQPFLVPLKADVQCVLIDEAPAAPRLCDALRVARMPVIVSASRGEWARGLAPEMSGHDGEPLVLRALEIPTAHEQAAPAVPALAWTGPARYAVALGALGVPAPFQWIAAAHGADSDGSTMPEALFQRVSFAGTPSWEPRDRGALRQIALEHGAGEWTRLLDQLIRSSNSAEAGLLVVLIQRLRLSDQAPMLDTLRTSLMERVRTLSPGTATERATWARVWRVLGEHALAEELLGPRMGTESSAEVLDEWARLLAVTGRHAEAQRVVEKIGVGSSPDEASFWTLLDLTMIDDPIAAEELLRVARGCRPHDPWLVVAQGQAAARRRAADASGVAFEQARHMWPGCAAIFREWGRALDRLGRFREAAARLEQAVTIEPWNPRGHIELACVRLKAGDIDAAGRHVRDALVLAPLDVEALALFAQCQALSSRAPALSSVKGGAVAVAKLGRTLRIPVQAFRPVPQAGYTESVRIAAAGEGPATYARYTEGSTMVALTVDATGRLIANVEVADRPVAGAVVALVELEEVGRWVERALGVTDAQGEVVLGPASALVRFLSRAPGARCKVALELPLDEAA